jgi:hypothetical protein
MAWLAELDKLTVSDKTSVEKLMSGIADAVCDDLLVEHATLEQSGATLT